VLKDRLRPLIYVGITAPFIALPFVLGEYNLVILLQVLIWMIVAVSYRLISTTGEWSMAHLVMVGIGAYTSALLTRDLGYPFWVGAPIGGLAAAAFAAAIAYPLFRMKFIYFFLGSWAIGEAVRLSWQKFMVFGGAKGLAYIPRPSLGAFTFDTIFSYYYLTLGIAAACLAVLYLIDISRVGKTLRAIRSQDLLCESLGINVSGYKALAFIIGSFFAGIAGAVLGHFVGGFTPTLFAWSGMICTLIWVIVGGLNTFWGPIVGVLILIPFQEQLRINYHQYMPIFYGVALIVVLLTLPDGLESVPTKIREWRTARRGRGVAKRKR